jgi:hypothetical protein
MRLLLCHPPPLLLIPRRPLLPSSSLVPRRAVRRGACSAFKAQHAAHGDGHGAIATPSAWISGASSAGRSYAASPCPRVRCNSFSPTPSPPRRMHTLPRRSPVDRKRPYHSPTSSHRGRSRSHRRRRSSSDRSCRPRGCTRSRPHSPPHRLRRRSCRCCSCLHRSHGQQTPTRRHPRSPPKPHGPTHHRSRLAARLTPCNTAANRDQVGCLCACRSRRRPCAHVGNGRLPVPAPANRAVISAALPPATTSAAILILTLVTTLVSLCTSTSAKAYPCASASVEAAANPRPSPPDGGYARSASRGCLMHTRRVPCSPPSPAPRLLGAMDLHRRCHRHRHRTTTCVRQPRLRLHHCHLHPHPRAPSPSLQRRRRSPSRPCTAAATCGARGGGGKPCERLACHHRGSNWP